MLRCFVFDGEPATLAAFRRADTSWVAVISSRAIWGTRDWYPRILSAISDVRPDVVALAPLVNEPGPDWQVAGPEHDDYFAHRALPAQPALKAMVPAGSEPAAPAALVVRARVAAEVLAEGLENAHAKAATRGRVMLLPTVYVVHHRA